jgi:cytidylate kinase
MAVITISRQYGSGGDEIAARVCRIMGYRLFDKYLILRAAAESGLTQSDVIDLCEENYKLQGFFDRLYNRTRQAAQAWAWADEGPRVHEDFPIDEETAIFLVRKAVSEAYKTGNMVILGRGGQVILRGYPDVLHVRIEAPLEERILAVREKMLEAQGAGRDPIEARRAAQDLIATRDASSADYLRRFYGVDWASPLNYHLVINTGRMDADLAAETIAELAMRLQRDVKPAPARRMARKEPDFYR